MTMPNRDDLPAAPEDQKGWPWTLGRAAADRSAADRPAGSARVDLPKISIITPSFQQGEFLEQSIRSVLLQGYPNLEYQVLDGGSRDASPRIIERYRPWLSYARSEPDGGQSQTLNEGLDRATGDILAWMNSDDVYQPGALWTAARYLAGRSRAMLVGTSILTDGPGSLEGRRDVRFPSLAAMLYEARSFPQPSVFFTRDLWQAAGPIDESLYFAMDYDLWLRMVPRARQIFFIDDGLSVARTHPDQKGQRAAQDGDEDRFVGQRVRASLAGARTLGLPAAWWLGQIWGRRIAKAWRLRRASMLRGALFHRAAWRLFWRPGTVRRR